MSPAKLDPFVREVRLRELPGDEREREAFPWSLAAVRALHEQPLALDARCTFLVGANGSGKSTLLEAIAVAAGLGVQSGGRNVITEDRDDELVLGHELTLVRGSRRPKTDFFLRAEGMLGFATRLDQLQRESGVALAPYGGKSLHEQSHGESFLALINHRLGPNGLYLLDEPESALSPQSLLALLTRMHDLVEDGCQFIVATHAPILLAFPGAQIVEVSPDGLNAIDYDDVEAVRLTRLVLDDPPAMMRRLFEA